MIFPALQLKPGILRGDSQAAFLLKCREPYVVPAASVASWLSFDANTTEQALWRDLSFLLGGDAEAKKLLPILWGITEAGFRSWPSAVRINALKHALNRVYQGIIIIYFLFIFYLYFYSLAVGNS